MVSEPENDIHPSYITISEPEDDNGLEVLSFDEDDMFGLVDNPDEIIVIADSDDDTQASFEDVPVDPDSEGDGQASVDDVISLDLDSDDEAQTSLHDVISLDQDSSDKAQTCLRDVIFHT